MLKWWLSVQTVKLFIHFFNILTEHSWWKALKTVRTYFAASISPQLFIKHIPIYYFVWTCYYRSLKEKIIFKERIHSQVLSVARSPFMVKVLHRWSNYNAYCIITSSLNHTGVVKLQPWISICLSCYYSTFAPLQNTVRRPTTTCNQAMWKSIKAEGLTCLYRSYTLFDRINTLLGPATAGKKVLGINP